MFCQNVLCAVRMHYVLSEIMMCLDNHITRSKKYALHAKMDCTTNRSKVCIELHALYVSVGLRYIQHTAAEIEQTKWNPGSRFLFQLWYIGV
jgi:hypothetical protein